MHQQYVKVVFSFIIIGLLASCSFTERLRLSKKYNRTNNVASTTNIADKDRATKSTSTPIPTRLSSAPLTQLKPVSFALPDHLSLSKSTNPDHTHSTSVSTSASNNLSLFFPMEKTQQSIPVVQNEASNNLRNWAAPDEIILIILAILIPPLAVYLYFDGLHDHFWINLILTIIFWLPGVIHALLVVTGTI
jgi:uncharacterized membrane protein YqaE (UPF0057 family)